MIIDSMSWCTDICRRTCDCNSGVARGTWKVDNHAQEARFLVSRRLGSLHAFNKARDTFCSGVSRTPNGGREADENPGALASLSRQQSQKSINQSRTFFPLPRQQIWTLGKARLQQTRTAAQGTPRLARPHPVAQRRHLGFASAARLPTGRWSVPCPPGRPLHRTSRSRGAPAPVRAERHVLRLFVFRR